MSYGRAELSDRVGRHEGTVLLLTGDSGVGKSTVLALSTADRSGWVSARPTTLARSPGSLHDAFLEQLGVVLSQLVERGLSVVDLRDRLAETGRRLLNEQVSVLGRVALAEIVAVLRGRVGDDVGKAVQEYAADIWPDDAETLAAKTSRARDPLAFQVLAAFAETAVALAGSTHLALSLDQGQRLSAEDHRVLADLGEHMPRGIHVRVAYATDRGERTRAVAELRADCPAIDEIEVPPLGEDATAEWLLGEGLDPGLASRLTRQTGGYPLLIEGAVAHLKGGGDLDEIPRHEQLARRTRVSFDQLSPGAAAAARALSVLADPLPESELRQLVGIDDVAEWATVVSELEGARILSVEVNGLPWFHTERREFVFHDCLTPEQRDEAAATAAEVMWGNGIRTTDFPRAAQFAALVSFSSRYQEQDQELAAVAKLDQTGLAVIGALLELAVGNRIVADADDLFSHALAFAPAPRDPESVLRALVELGVVVAATNEWATAVAAGWSPRTQATIQGLSTLTLLRPAVPRMAELMFELGLRDVLGEFQMAHLGIGNPSIGSLGRIASGGHPQRGYIDRREDQLGTNLLLRGTVADGTRFYCAARFSEPGLRDGAHGRAAGAEIATALGDVRVADAVVHPLGPVQSQRYAAAFRRALGETLVHVPNSGEIKRPPPEGMSDAEIAEERVRVAQVLADLAMVDEKYAMELDSGYLFAWSGGDEYWEEAVVVGGDQFETRLLPEMHAVGLNDHFDGLRLRLALGLRADQAVVHRHGSYGKDSRRDPVAAEISYRRGRSRVYNSAQPVLRVSLSASELEPLLADAFRAELHAARVLAEYFPASVGRDPIGPRSLWLLLALDQPDAGWVAGARGSAIYAEGPSDDDLDHVFVAAVAGTATGGWVYTVEQAVFDETFPGVAGESTGIGSIDAVLADLLCLESGDMRLVWPDE